MDAAEFLQTLVGQPLCYGIKSPDTELYEFAFGRLVTVMTLHGKNKGKEKKVGEYILHILCRFEVIWRNGERRVKRYYEDTPCEAFHADVKRLVGLKVKRVGLSDKNDLWLDLGDYWVVFATDEGEEESWRFFMAGGKSPHLVASDTCLNFPG